ncbi:RNA pyrophosphohydrolase [uncultured Methylobacterium sp.]|uniref:RNA pyrophosphohydrolase n=1 Tax=uncultured Methylobacterium sp. TaxID=157278 RepID=UPI0035C9688B
MTTDESRSRADGPPYRPCVGITLINRAGLVLVGRRRQDAGPEHVAGSLAWQMPQGGIDAGEAPHAAALRELYEETNVAAASVRLLAEAPDWLSYDLPPDVMTRAWNGRYRGQTQRWFAFGFLGSDDEIDVARPGGGAHAAEFEAWRWAPFAELPGLIVPFKRPVYEGVVAAFAPLGAWSAGA